MVHEEHGRVGGEVKTFLHTLFHKLDANERIEVRFRQPGPEKLMNQRFFKSPDEALGLVLSIKRSYDVYVGVAPRRGDFGTKDGVDRLFALWADLDAKGKHTQDTRRRQLKGLLCPPSVVVWSGGGYHPYWLLREPVRGSEDLGRAERIMARIKEGLDGDPVQDRSRILRIPGTLNHKQDRPRSVRLLHHDSKQRYDLVQLEEMTQSFPELGKDTEKGGTREGKVPKDVLRNPIPKDERNVALASVAGSLRNRGLDEGTITVVLLEVNRLRCVPPMSKTETEGIARSVSRYTAGNLRYRKSSVKRVRQSGEGR